MSESLQNFLSIFGINGSFLKMEFSAGSVSLQLSSCFVKGKKFSFFSFILLFVMVTTFVENKNVFLKYKAVVRPLRSLLSDCHASALTWAPLPHQGFFFLFFFLIIFLKEYTSSASQSSCLQRGAATPRTSSSLIQVFKAL